MDLSQGLVKQRIPDSIVMQCTEINIACFEEDGTTPRNMTTGEYKMTFTAEGVGVSILKTSDAGQILFGQPDSFSVQILLLEIDTDFNNSTLLEWELRATDINGNCEVVNAYGEWQVIKWAS